MNIGMAIKAGSLKIGDTLWKIIRNSSGVPIEIKEVRFEQMLGENDIHYLRFWGVKDGKMYSAYSHHESKDWFKTEKEAFNKAWDSLTEYFLLNRAELEELENIQGDLRNNHPDIGA